MRHGKIVGVGWNYKSHLEETNAVLPEAPLLFLKPSTCLVGDGEPIRLPCVKGEIHHEVELALIIGEACTRVSEEEASSRISHLAAFNDITARGLQNEARARGDPWTVSKGMDGFGPISRPAPLSAVRDINDLDLELRVNGVLRQRGNTCQMVFGPAFLVSYISHFMTLEPGDIITTGTPEGVGPLLPGDVVEARVSEVGTVRNPII